MTFVEKEAPKWLINKLTGLEKPLKQTKQTLVVTDAFGTPLEPGQEVIYHQEGSYTKPVQTGKIIGVVGTGEIIIQYGTYNKVSTLASGKAMFDHTGTGTLRYMQIYIVQ